MMQTEGVVTFFEHLWNSSIQSLLSTGQKCHSIVRIVVILESIPQLHQEPNPTLIIFIFNHIKCHWKDTIICINSSSNQQLVLISRFKRNLVKKYERPTPICEAMQRSVECNKEAAEFCIHHRRQQSYATWIGLQKPFTIPGQMAICLPDSMIKLLLCHFSTSPNL
ncbi:Os10g0104750 [Oryza sativa Japonica Group]|uniref:Os10g0104750 protein n=1 Tax=Oryza sativa subsp. japonica TaxID=39947 RepID=A0A0P0XRP6_ORYSJ|nr:Os10g0104750 [Oryza sativa Japonica Group]